MSSQSQKDKTGEKWAVLLVPVEGLVPAEDD